MGNPVGQAGAIVFKTNKNIPEVLLILSKKKPQVRIFPKGHIETGENAAAAALRELGEEAGVSGKLLEELGTVRYVFREKDFAVKYYLMRYSHQQSDGEPGRQPHWYTVDDACNLLPFDQLRDLLRRAASRFIALTS